MTNDEARMTNGLAESQPRRRIVRRVFQLFFILLVTYSVIVTVLFFWQRSLLFMPSHDDLTTSLAPWYDGDQRIGYCREVTDPQTIWLMTHGNAGQAAHRGYVLNRLSDRDSFYVLEYPGYGLRDGSPSRESFNQAAAEAYRLLRSQNPDTPVCALGESIGSGPACSLAQQETPPDKIVLVVPFDCLASVAGERFPFLPVRLLLLDNWDNVEALRAYAGPVEVFGARDDRIIPVEHAKALADGAPNSHFTLISGGHNDWSLSDQVEIRL